MQSVSIAREGDITVTIIVIFYLSEPRRPRFLDDCNICNHLCMQVFFSRLPCVAPPPPLLFRSTQSSIFSPPRCSRLSFFISFPSSSASFPLDRTDMTDSAVRKTFEKGDDGDIIVISRSTLRFDRRIVSTSPDIVAWHRTDTCFTRVNFSSGLSL